MMNFLAYLAQKSDLDPQLFNTYFNLHGKVNEENMILALKADMNINHPDVQAKLKDKKAETEGGSTIEGSTLTLEMRGPFASDVMATIYSFFGIKTISPGGMEYMLATTQECIDAGKANITRIQSNLDSPGGSVRTLSNVRSQLHAFMERNNIARADHDIHVRGMAASAGVDWLLTAGEGNKTADSYAEIIEHEVVGGIFGGRKSGQQMTNALASLQKMRSIEYGRALNQSEGAFTKRIEESPNGLRFMSAEQAKEEGYINEVNYSTSEGEGGDDAEAKIEDRPNQEEEEEIKAEPKEELRGDELRSKQEQEIKVSEEIHETKTPVSSGHELRSGGDRKRPAHLRSFYNRQARSQTHIRR